MTEEALEELFAEKLKKELPKTSHKSKDLLEAFERALEDTTPERAGDPRRVKAKDKGDTGWTI